MVNVRAALQETPELLSVEERKEIDELVVALEKCTTRDDLLSGLDRLKKATHAFGERRMDFAVNQILGGKKIS